MAYSNGMPHMAKAIIIPTPKGIRFIVSIIFTP